VRWWEWIEPLCSMLRGRDSSAAVLGLYEFIRWHGWPLARRTVRLNDLASIAAALEDWIRSGPSRRRETTFADCVKAGGFDIEALDSGRSIAFGELLRGFSARHSAIRWSARSLLAGRCPHLACQVNSLSARLDQWAQILLGSVVQSWWNENRGDIGWRVPNGSARGYWHVLSVTNAHRAISSVYDVSTTLAAACRNDSGLSRHAVAFVRDLLCRHCCENRYMTAMRTGRLDYRPDVDRLLVWWRVYGHELVHVVENDAFGEGTIRFHQATCPFAVARDRG